MARSLGIPCLGNLAAGQLGEGRQDELGVGHVAAEVLALQPLQVLVPAGGEPGSLLMDDVGEKCVLPAGLDVVLLPVVGELAADVLATHALLDPLFGTTLSLPVFAGAVEAMDGYE